jgi:hypothetical protein
VSLCRGGAGCLALACLLWPGLVATVRAADPPLPEEKDWANFKYQKSADCTRCHVSPGANDPTDLSLLIEYPIWKIHDKHALAYAVIEGPRGQDIGKALHADLADPNWASKLGCMNCHAMEHLAKQSDGTLDKYDGVSCGGCHGPSSKWIGDHDKPAWRTKTPEFKHEQGLRDLRHPEVRARLCASCHIGNAQEGKVVTHAMMAAGHPPLPPLETATFSRNMPQHWRDARNVPLFKNPTPEMVKNYHLEDLAFNRSKFALVGGVVAFRETMRLAHDRADLASKYQLAYWPELADGQGGEDHNEAARKRWPEIALAHSDCYACHHDLKVPGIRAPRGFGYLLPGLDVKRAIPGRPLLRTWPTAALQAAAFHADKGKPEERLKALKAKLDALTDASNARPYGRPEDIRKATEDLIQWSNDLIKALEAARFDNDSVRDTMQYLARLYAPEEKKADDKTPAGRTVIPDFEQARTIASILEVLHEEYELNGGKDDNAQAALDQLREELRLTPYKLDKRLGIILEVVKQAINKPTIDTSAFVAVAGYDPTNRLQARERFTNKQLLEKLNDDTFLDQVRKNLKNDTFNRLLREGKNSMGEEFKTLLQKLSDEETQLALDAIANYDAAKVQAALRNFAAALKK